MARFDRDRRVEHGECLFEPVLLAQHIADRGDDQRIAGADRQRLFEMGVRAGEIAALLALPGQKVEQHRRSLPGRHCLARQLGRPRYIVCRQRCFDIAHFLRLSARIASSRPVRVSGYMRSSMISLTIRQDWLLPQRCCGTGLSQAAEV